MPSGGVERPRERPPRALVGWVGFDRLLEALCSRRVIPGLSEREAEAVPVVREVGLEPGGFAELLGGLATARGQQELRPEPGSGSQVARGEPHCVREERDAELCRPGFAVGAGQAADGADVRGGAADRGFEILERRRVGCVGRHVLHAGSMPWEGATAGPLYVSGISPFRLFRAGTRLSNS